MIVQVNNRISQDFDSFQMKKHHGLPEHQTKNGGVLLSVEANDEMMKCFRATTAFENDQKIYFPIEKKTLHFFNKENVIANHHTFTPPPTPGKEAN